MAVNQVKAGAVLNYVIIGLNIVTGLLYTPFMLQQLGQSQYGLYSLVASVIAYLTLLDFGFGSAIVRYTAKIRATGTKKDEWSLYGMFISSYVLIGIVVAIAGFFLYANVDSMFDKTMTPEELGQAKIMMALMVFNLVITFPFSVFGSIISAYEKFVFQRVFSICRILLSTAVMIIVLYMGYKAVAMVVIQTVFSVGCLIANLLYCKYKLHIKVCFKYFNIPLLKEIMIFSFWNFVGNITDRIYWSTGQFVLGMTCGTAAVAVFSLAVTLMGFYMSMSTSINSVLLPRITVLSTDKKNDGEISRLFICAGRLQFCVLALILSGFTIFGKSFIKVWSGSEYAETYTITLMFFTSLLCPLIQNVGLTILQARAQQKFRSLTYIFIALLSLGLQLFLSRTYGATGCAIGVTVALLLGQWIVMNIYYKVKQRLDIISFWKQIGRMAIVPIVLAVLGYTLVPEISSWGKLALFVLIYVVLYIPLFWRFSMGQYEKDQLRPILSRISKFIKH
jgi:O-antigen/teichoic acid export membrane protein